MKGLKKAGGNWVDGDRFFDREAELESLSERVREGTHTLLTAQRRMGKTSLVRELLRRLAYESEYETIFVDLEGAHDSADAVAEIAIEARSVRSVWSRIKSSFGSFLSGIGDRIEAVEVADVKVRLRAGINARNWRQRGDRIFAALTLSEKPVVLAIDELPILINRLLKGQDYRITPERREAADQFLSWLRKNGQTHKGGISIIILGSVGLEPILKQAGLSAQANIFSSFELKPWSRDISIKCLKALASTYDLDLSREVRSEMCRRLRCCVPHHVQQFFDHLHEHLRRHGKRVATVADIGHVYAQDLLSVRGQIDLEHYESRLRMVLGSESYKTALSLLTEAAVDGGLLTPDSIEKYRIGDWSGPRDSDSIDDVLYTLEHDGYLAADSGGYRFVSGLLEDWWKARHGAYFTPIERRRSKRIAK